MMKFTKFIKLVFSTVSPGICYANNWHIGVMADRLHAAFLGRINRLIINVPPRSMKSICASVAWPAWIMGLNPCARIIVASYSQILSEKLSLDTKLVLESQWYRNTFPETEICSFQNTKRKFQTTKLGFRFATSVCGSITGEGGNFLILDDPMNPLQASSHTYRQKVFEWFNQSFLTRLNDRKKGAVIIVMHRLHDDDLIGKILRGSAAKSWEILSIPLLSERRRIFFSRSHNCTKASSRIVLYKRSRDEPIRKEYRVRYIEKLKREVGTYVFSSQYQQRPISSMKNGLIKYDWINRYQQCDSSSDKSCIVQSWDTASSTGENSDFSACTTWYVAGRSLFLLDVRRVKLPYSSLKREVQSLYTKWNPSVILMEDKASGQQIIQEMREYLPIWSCRPTDSKLSRVLRSIPSIQAGNLYLPFYALWLHDFEHEICSFPHAMHDDQVDSMTQVFLWSHDNISTDTIRIREI